MRINLSYPLYLSELAEKEVYNDVLISCVCTDSRVLKPGDLFVAIKGSNYDGADFIEYAKNIGAWVVSESKVADITVDNIDVFIAGFISMYKSKLNSVKKTVAITGSVGKTSTKTVLTKLLSTKFKVHSTNENQNNLLGTLFTVLSTPADTELLILEFGMNHTGEISVLSKVTRPDIAIITNVGTAHIGNLGSRQMIAKAKLEIEDGMLCGSPVLVPANEPLLKEAKNGIPISFEEDLETNIRFYPKYLSESYSTYEFSFKKDSHLIKIAQNDKRLACAVGFSLAVGSLLGLKVDDISDKASELTNQDFRQKLIEKNGYRIYDDTYSSSYEAVLCVIDYLISEYGEISCVLADMLELGDFSEELHTKLGVELSKREIRCVYLCGRYAESVANGIKTAKSHCNIYINRDTEELNATLDQIRDSYHGELLLIKGSHDTHTERLIDLLIN